MRDRAFRYTIAPTTTCGEYNIGSTHRLDLRASGRGYYEIVPHDRHLETVIADTHKEIRRTLKKGAVRVSYFDPRTDEEMKAKERAEMQLLKIEAIRRVARKR